MRGDPEKSREGRPRTPHPLDRTVALGRRPPRLEIVFSASSMRPKHSPIQPRLIRAEPSGLDIIEREPIDASQMALPFWEEAASDA